MTLQMFTSAIALVASMSVATTQASAAGCLKGAAVGAVAGHVAGHHAVVGAVGGCLVGRHMAKKKAAEEKRNRDAYGAPTKPPKTTQQ